jgi:hypothetical protein
MSDTKHGNFPSERTTPAALSPATFAAVDADMQRREAEYKRVLALRETPEYQAALRARGLK